MNEKTKEDFACFFNFVAFLNIEANTNLASFIFCKNNDTQ